MNIARVDETEHIQSNAYSGLPGLYVYCSLLAHLFVNGIGQLAFIVLLVVFGVTQTLAEMFPDFQVSTFVYFDIYLLNLLRDKQQISLIANDACEFNREQSLITKLTKMVLSTYLPIYRQLI